VLPVHPAQAHASRSSKHKDGACDRSHDLDRVEFILTRRSDILLSSHMSKFLPLVFSSRQQRLATHSQPGVKPFIAVDAP